jgi:hypothetical protein
VQVSFVLEFYGVAVFIPGPKFCYFTLSITQTDDVTKKVRCSFMILGAFVPA